MMGALLGYPKLLGGGKLPHRAKAHKSPRRI